MKLATTDVKSSKDFLLEVGHTPLLEFPRLTASLSPLVRIFAKAEWHNPGGSVKDRPAVWMIRQAEAKGLLRPGKTILDATSGNTGIAYAWIGARLGYPVRLAVPASINAERKKILEIYGADIRFTDPLEGSDGAIVKARELFRQEPDIYYYPDQYNNPDNWRAHFETTGPEIWEQTRGAVTHFVAGLGTSGTFRGTSTRLRQYRPDVRLISVQPDSPLHGLEGMKHMGTSIRPGIYDPQLADEEMLIDTETAQAMSVRAAKEEGILIGPSGGANLAAALTLGERSFAEGQAAVIVTILPDRGERYLNERFWKSA